ncbi:MAG: SAM-dependent methyltransferase [Nocardioides sp.]|uniref:class I SAM-dependent methyltransferase n=1 Tax=Nocardioides sp. TaxID=35761 RepID=UPI0039E33191
MTDPLPASTTPAQEEFAAVRTWLLDEARLLRAVASGRRRAARPEWRRVELRYVDLKAGRHLQVTKYDDTQAHTSNHLVGSAAATAVDELLAEPFGNWHVETVEATHQVRVGKKGSPRVHTRARTAPVEVERGHDRDKTRLLPPEDSVLVALGLSTGDGRVKPSRQAKYRQVEEFLQQLDAALTDALGKGRLRTPTEGDPLRVVDLGCGNAYLTFVAHRFLAEVRGLPVALTGVDTRADSRARNAALAESLGQPIRFVAESIAEVELTPAPEVVLALHACDTATDDALARAISWQAPVILAAPCCHHDVAAQLRRATAPTPYASIVRDGILRERFADTLTDALRASLLRAAGYRVDVVEFVESRHTPRNTMLRAVRRGRVDPGAREEYDDLVAAWGITPRLGVLLDRQASG